ncbi:DUF721 domain-containing protein [bacterium]|nr:DUF721 domain-containing protein [bacterium]
MQRLQRFLAKSLKEWKAEDAVAAGRVFALWPTIVGEAIAARTRPRFLRGGVLFVEAASSAWANELTMLKPRILKALDQHLGKGLIRDVRYQVAPTWQERKAYEAPEIEQVPVLPKEPLSPEEEQAIAEEVASRVSDPDLAEAARDLLSAVARRRAAKEKAGYRPCASCGALVPPTSDSCPICRLTGSER